LGSFEWSAWLLVAPPDENDMALCLYNFFIPSCIFLFCAFFSLALLSIKPAFIHIIIIIIKQIDMWVGFTVYFVPN
jgi:hypothetical protein